MGWRKPEYPGEFPSLGWLMAEWCQEFLIIPDGDRHGEPFVLTDEQLALMVRFYRLDPKTGSRVVRRSMVVRPKGWGKSPLLAACCAFELAGPAVFDGWDAAGEPVGRQWPTPLVQIAAVSEDQTDNTYRSLFAMMVDAPVVSAYGLTVGKTRIFRPGGGVIEPVTASAPSREGQRVTFAVLDETHLWFKGNGGVKLANTIRRNVGKMDGATFETSNAWEPGKGSVAEASAEAQTTAGVLVEHPLPKTTNVDLSAKRLLRSALKDVYGDAVGWVNLDRIVAEIGDPATTEADARRFYLNEIVAGSGAVYDPEKWNACARPGYMPEDGTQIAIGFDGAVTRDATAIVATEIGSGFQWLAGCWVRPENVEEWRVDVAAVDAAMSELFARFDVWRLAADPAHWQEQLAVWSGRWPGKVVEFWTSQRKRMVHAIAAHVDAVASGVLSHDGSLLLSSHVLNARRRDTRMVDADGRRLFDMAKESQDSPHKIDAAMAAVLSWDARSAALAAGVLDGPPIKKKSGKVYAFG